MMPLILIGITLALLGGFLALASWEQSRGLRLFGVQRARLDREAERAAFVIEHVDFGAYLREELGALMVWLGHLIAHFSLQGVRAAERHLTRAVRHLRAKVAAEEAAPRPTERQFVRALGDFKEELRQTRPEIPEL